MMAWVEEEMATVDFQDQRLNQRVKTVLSRLASKPQLSIPAACRGWDETQAAYRLFDNVKVTADKILQPHRSKTQERMKEHPLVLCIQDTSELNYSHQTETVGLGPLSYETHRGLLLHPTLAVTPDKLCLGVLDTLIWARDDEHFHKRKARASKSIDEKESRRWLDGYRHVCEIAKTMPTTQCVYMSDREGDIYEIFAEGYAQNHQADWLIRAAQNRLLQDDESLAEALIHADVMGTISYELPANHRRSSKSVVQELKAARVTLRPPERRSGEQLACLNVTVLMAQEINPPNGEEPLTWILLTNLAVTTAEQAKEKIQWYLCRWQIEVYFKVLKSGCKIQHLQLEHVDRLKPALALYMIIAWRVLYLTLLGRECPDIECDVVFEEKEWHAI